MRYDQEVKDLAYTLDPPCWISYSGKGRHFKAVMDGRRTASLELAQQQIDGIKRRRHAQANPNPLKEALDLALGYLIKLEPGHSCAVSDEFVAMAAVAGGDYSQPVMDVIRRAAQTMEEY
jgi:hypothetical protein